MPIRSRARSAQSLRRDEQILDAALAEVVAVGFDPLGMHPVARRLGVTAGTIYSRHETPDELAVAVWSERCGRETLQLLDDCVETALGRRAGDDLVERGVSGSDALMAGLEVLAIARRRPELAEVVVPEVMERIRWNDRDPQQRSRIAFLIGIVWGMILHDNVSKSQPDVWRVAMTLILRAMRTEATLPEGEWQPELGEHINARTEDALRDALINSASAVIGQVGLHSTTVSRVGRRAGLTAGAVYTQYASKDDLLIDAVRVLLDEAVSDNRPLTDRTVNRIEMGNVAAHLLTRGGGQRRRPWLRFRLEAYIAASHRRDLAAILDELHTMGRSRYHDMLAPAGVKPAVADLVAIVGQAIPLGLAVLDAYIDDLDTIDFRHVTMPLLGFVADVSGAP
jgi:AcrR family transcriptional regulator